MARRNVIRTPWLQRWRRFRYNVLPLACFAACVCLAFWMWKGVGERPNAVGEVEAVRIDVAVADDGVLQLSPGTSWALFDHVESGQLLARIDDRPLRSRLETLRADLRRLQTEIDAGEARLRADQSDRQRDHRQEEVRLCWQVERCRLEMLDRKALVDAERIELAGLNSELEFLQRAATRLSLSELELNERRVRRDEVASRLEVNEAARGEAETHWKTAVAALGSYSPLQSADAELLLAPLKSALATHEFQIRELERQIEDLDIRAPITGTICSIHRWPGQHVRAGDAVATLAATQGRYIISYVREQQGFRPSAGMPVTLHLRQADARSLQTLVDQVGPQVELIPPHHRHDPAVPEWGQPVRIAPPAGTHLRPGELVDVIFKSRARGDSG